LVETGDEALVSVRAIAERAGCTAPAIYMHFGDKDDLFREVCELRFKELNLLFDEVAAEVDEPLPQLRALGRAYFRFGVENPEHYRVLMMAKVEHAHHQGDFSLENEDRTEGDRAFMRLVFAVRRCIEAGHLRAADPLVISVTLWSGLHGLVSLLINAPNFPWPDRDELIDFVLDTQLRGLLA
jgi:AcrR family transcriptional regulator